MLSTALDWRVCLPFSQELVQIDSKLGTNIDTINPPNPQLGFKPRKTLVRIQNSVHKHHNGAHHHECGTQVQKPKDLRRIHTELGMEPATCAVR